MNVWFCPSGMLADEGVIVTVGSRFTVTVALPEASRLKESAATSMMK